MMKHAVCAVVALTLTACANDRYTVILGGNGSPDRYASDLHFCKRDALDKYYAGQSHGGAIVGGVLGGAIGGALGGVIDGSESQTKLGDINPNIENCMRIRGYEGTSEN